MKRVLKNVSKVAVKTTYNGKQYMIPAKGSIVLDHGGHDEQAADYLLQTYSFLIDISKRYERKVEMKPLTKALPKPVPVKSKKVRTNIMGRLKEFIS